MKYNEFFKSLKEGQIDPVYLFCGTEAYVMKSALSQLQKAVVADEAMRDMNVDRLDKAGDGDRVAEVCETFPFMAEKRLVILTDSPFLTKSESKAENEDSLLAYLDRPCPTTVAVFVCAEPDKRRKVYKELAKHTVVEFNALSDDELRRWIEKTLRGDQLAIAPDALSFLVEYADPRPEALAVELEKLACFKGGAGTVTKADISAVVTPGNDYNVFKMTDAVLAGRTDAALQTLGTMLQNREEPLMILGAIARQYRTLMRLKCMIEDKVAAGEICQKLGLRDFAYKKMAAICNKTSAERLKKALDLCYQTDRGLKTGTAFPAVALHELILRLGAK